MSIKSILTLTLVLGSSASIAECVAPAHPSMPDGGSASMADMIEGQKSVKSFQADNIAYMACLEKLFTEAEAAAKTGSDEEKAAAMAVHKQALSEYNSAVSAEEEVAGQFNTEIREYKEANPS